MKTFILYTAVLLIYASTFSQPNREQIKTLKIAFITEKLDLSTQEAQQFWPIYNNFEKENDKLRHKSLGRHRATDESYLNDLSDEEARALLIMQSKMEQQRVSLRQNLIKDLLEVLPPKKILLLMVSEREFKQKMLKELHKRRGNYKKH